MRVRADTDDSVLYLLSLVGGRYYRGSAQFSNYYDLFLRDLRILCVNNNDVNYSENFSYQKVINEGVAHSFC